MDLSQLLLIICVGLFAAIAALWDWRTNRLPNSLTVTAFLAALVFHIVVGAVEGGWRGVGEGLFTALAGFATGFGILFVLWLIGGGGGGDVKLMGALGAWLGPERTLWVFLISAGLVMFGSVGVLAWQASRNGVGRTRARYFNRLPVTIDGKTVQGPRRRVLPYGIPVALATWCVLAYISIKG
jgi:prepilin peptidase CpaA